MTQKYLIGGIAAALVAGAGYWGWQALQPARSATGSGGPLVQITVPTLTGEAKAGAAVFAEKCASCHGTNADGREGGGPPLVHKIYEPSHHGDMAFALAPLRGVQQHHWPFGNMPPIEGVTETDVLQILAFVRTLQRANGIN